MDLSFTFPHQKPRSLPAHARKAARVWKEHGALDLIKCVVDDVKPGKITSFPQSVELKKGETVVFSWIIYK